MWTKGLQFTIHLCQNITLAANSYFTCLPQGSVNVQKSQTSDDEFGFDDFDYNNLSAVEMTRILRMINEPPLEEGETIALQKIYTILCHCSWHLKTNEKYSRCKIPVIWTHFQRQWSTLSGFRVEIEKVLLLYKEKFTNKNNVLGKYFKVYKYINAMSYEVWYQPVIITPNN